MRYRYVIADVFTDRPFSGNPLAVFPEAEGLFDEQMQQIAAELNLSETVFVLPPSDEANTKHLRIFTPKTELPFAGHPTIGTAHVLATLGKIPLDGGVTRVVFEEAVGPVVVFVEHEPDGKTSAQLSAPSLPEWGPAAPPSEDISTMLSLRLEDLLGGEYPPEAISCGVPFLLVPLRELDALRRAQVRQDHWTSLLAAYWAPHLYVFVCDRNEESDVRARMFAPAMGIVEDPATGAAVAALAGYLGSRSSPTSVPLVWRVEQGVEMGRPSLLEVEADKEGGEITAVRVGGTAAFVGQGEIEAPTPGGS